MTIEDMGATGRTEHGARASERLALIVAGPTASGKSALALALAQRLGGTVINADAMQCYAELRVVTARPSEADEALAQFQEALQLKPDDSAAQINLAKIKAMIPQKAVSP